MTLKQVTTQQFSKRWNREYKIRESVIDSETRINPVLKQYSFGGCTIVNWNQNQSCFETIQLWRLYNCQLLIVNSQLSIVNCQLSIVICQLSMFNNTALEVVQLSIETGVTMDSSSPSTWNVDPLEIYGIKVLNRISLFRFSSFFSPLSTFSIWNLWNPSFESNFTFSLFFFSHFFPLLPLEIYGLQILDQRIVLLVKK